jgi:hypothetical protein
MTEEHEVAHLKLRVHVLEEENRKKDELLVEFR